MDDADRTDQRIMDTVNEGINRARRHMGAYHPSPIVLEMDGMRFGMCAYCEEAIRPGNVFCDADPTEPENSCAKDWERLQDAKKRNGVR